MSERDVREDVSRAYADALRRSKAGTGGGCCGGSGCCGSAGSFGTLAVAAGYGEEREAYRDAAASSFGCGNPLAFSGVQPGQTVLDLGSGAGFDLLVASDKVGPQGTVIGIDMTDDMLATARENAKRAGKTNIDLRKGYIEALPVESGTVDWVISNCVINLSPDKPAVFREIARVLKPGGRFSISDIVAQDLPEWLRESARAYAACVAGAISEQEYLRGLGAAGLSGVEVAERLVYSAEQMRALVGDGLSDLVLPAGAAISFEELEGKIWSAKFIGGKT
ncbi:MAG: arsenite methyltransferase [Desulfocurvibacter africanus]